MQNNLQEKNEEKWDLVLESKHKFFSINLKEIIQYRDLIWLFVKRDFSTQFKQTILGPIWYVIQPLITTVINTFVFGNLAQIGTDGVPYILFYFAGTLLWSYFTACLGTAADTFRANQGMFSKVYFPRFAVIISNCISAAIKTGIQFLCLMIFYVYYLVVGANIHPSWGILLFPFLILWLAILGSGIGMIFSALTTKYRDLSQVLGFATGLAMYITPVVYPLSEAPADFAWFFYINPVSAPVELFRVFFYGAGNVPLPMTFLSIAMTATFFIFGLLLFNRGERTFVDVI